MRAELGLEPAFGEVLKQYRTAACLSQEKLALEAGLDRTFISLLERGRRQPTLTTLVLIAEALGQPPERLLADTLARLRRA